MIKKLKTQIVVSIGITGMLLLSSFQAFDDNNLSNGERIYSSELQTGDSLIIISSFLNCFNSSQFTLKVYRDSSQFRIMYSERNQGLFIYKSLPLDFRRDLIEFEQWKVPGITYGVGSSCRMIFGLNDEPYDTLNQCPKEQSYIKLVKRIKTDI